jgi:hypothetical protein
MQYQVFTSYAVADRTRSMKRFMEAFSEAARVALGGVENTHVFHDYVSIVEGTEWKPVLTEAANRASMVVFLISPTYFMRSWCGRELEAFHRRYEAWKKTTTAAERARAPLLFPIVWEPETMRPIPTKLADFQFFGVEELKIKDGQGLIDLAQSGTSADLKAFALKLARSIKQSRNLGHALPPLECDNLEDLPSAFEEISMPYDAHLWVASEGLRNLRYIPGTNKSVRDIAEDGAIAAGAFVHTLNSGDEFSSKWAGIKAQRQMILVVANAGESPHDKLKAFNRLAISPQQLVLLLIDSKAATNGVPRSVEEWLAEFDEEGCFHRAHESHFTASALLALSAQDKAEVLVRSARQALMNKDRGARVEDSDLQKSAQAKGIDTTQKSTL